MILRPSVDGLEFIREDGIYRLDSPVRLGDIIPAQETTVAKQTATSFNFAPQVTTDEMARRIIMLIGDARPAPADVAPTRGDSETGQAAGGIDKEPFTIKKVSPLWIVLILIALFFITAGGDIKAMGVPSGHLS